LVMFLVGWLIARSTPAGDPGHGIVYVAIGVGMLLAGLYEVVLSGLFGQTLGKRLLGIKVVWEATGRPPGVARALVRFLVLWAFWMLTVAAFVMICTDKQRRRAFMTRQPGRS
jgi:uncharacterized RDD family membrane protein YckC